MTTAQGRRVLGLNNRSTRWQCSPSGNVGMNARDRVNGTDSGYIIFNRHDNSKEVWRYTCDFWDFEMPEDFKPDESMIKVSQEAAQCFASPTNHGHFRPCITKIAQYPRDM
ncbi:hypothetical protein DEU56DRAFT_756129 [Suillus clintonianus]|uniref:uncharacterized protein n=1 Tax=Suillus clintonianus TaxID=1904413 RepID=UPI001B864B8A|nr:uncharacterized protein DEU56DRAFT_756129 [Suillus clintonianus]KAG2136994.1 hypothetical protein DEU56DRAFT_756129 [Suillus clintonianus]